MKATMMKVSDPIIFGHCVEAYLGDVLEDFEIEFNSAGFNPNNGLSDFYRAIETLNPEKQAAIKAKLEEELENRPALAMVNSDKGITNLHVPKRRHHRRIHARHDPCLGSNVGTGREPQGHQSGHT